MQAQFVTDLFKRLKAAGINTALDTSGCVFNEEVSELLKYTDLVLLDHKYSGKEDYFKFTGGHLEDTEMFLSELEKRGINTWLRRVIIPGKSDSTESVKALNETARRFSCVSRIELLPFRDLCREKYENMGIPFPLKDTLTPTKEKMEELSALLDKKYIR